MLLDKINLTVEEKDNKFFVELKGAFTEGEVIDFIEEFMMGQDAYSLLQDVHLNMDYSTRTKLAILSVISQDLDKFENKLLGIVFNKTIRDVLQAPCVCESVIEDEGILNATEEIFGIFVPQNKFDQIHAEAHKIIKICIMLEEDRNSDSGNYKHRTLNLNLN